MSNLEIKSPVSGTREAGCEFGIRLVAGVDKEKDQPRLRWIWRRGAVWTLAWRMPFGLTTARLLKEKQAIEERLNCSAEFWYDRGLVWMRAGTARLPERVTCAGFYRGRGPRSGMVVLGSGAGAMLSHRSDAFHVRVDVACTGRAAGAADPAYHLLLDLELLPVDTCVDLIVAAARSHARRTSRRTWSWSGLPTRCRARSVATTSVVGLLS